MSKWKIISRHTREVLGEEEAATQRQALEQASLKYGDVHRDIEASALSRRESAGVELEVSPAQAAEIIQKWAIDEMGFRPGAVVRVLVGGSYLPPAYLSRVGSAIARVSESDEPEAYEADPVEAMELVEQSLP